MHRRDAESGFTTVELVVALAIMSVVTFQVLAVMSSQQQTYVSQKRVLETQGDARLIADMIVGDIRMAGFMLPTMIGVSSIDGGTGAADALCTSDPTVIDESVLADDLMTRFAGSAITAGQDLGASASNVRVTTAEQDVDGDGNADYDAGQGVIISDGVSSHCARVTSVAGDRVNFTPATPGGFSILAADGRVAPAVVYEVTADGLERNAMLMAPHVEDLQIEFAVDISGDGIIGGGEFPIDNLNNDPVGSDTADIRGVQLSILTRTSTEDPNISGPGRQGVANRNPSGVADAFRRRLVTGIVAPRNML